MALGQNISTGTADTCSSTFSPPIPPRTRIQHHFLSLGASFAPGNSCLSNLLGQSRSLRSQDTKVNPENGAPLNHWTALVRPPVARAPPRRTLQSQSYALGISKTMTQGQGVWRNRHTLAAKTTCWDLTSNTMLHGINFWPRNYLFSRLTHMEPTFQVFAWRACSVLLKPVD